MKSVGEAMAIGRNFTEALQKALRSLEKGEQLPLGRRTSPRPSDEIDPRRAPPARPTAASSSSSRRCAAALSVEEVHEADGIDPWFLDQMALIKRDRGRASRAAAELDPGAAARWPSPRLQRRPDRHAARRCPRPWCARCATPSGCARSTRRSTPAPPSSRRRRRTTTQHLRRGERGRPARAARRHHPRLRPEPHRPGHRVRLLLRARELRPARRRLRHRHGQLQPRDGLHRLRHEQTASTSSRSPSRTSSRSSTPSGRRPVAGVIVQLGGQTPLGLAKALKAEGVPIVGTSPEAIDLAEDRGAFGRVLDEAEPARAQARHRLRADEAISIAGRSATRCSCGRATCSAAAAWRSSTTTRP
jgi:carbamoyl-phosphate synthase large subunit